MRGGGIVRRQRADEEDEEGEEEAGEAGEEEEAGVSILLSSQVSECNASISSSVSSSCSSSALVLSSDIVESSETSSLREIRASEVVKRRYSHTATSTVQKTYSSTHQAPSREHRSDEQHEEQSMSTIAQC